MVGRESEEKHQWTLVIRPKLVEAVRKALENHRHEFMVETIT
jgi:hypothetical protein